MRGRLLQPSAPGAQGMEKTSWSQGMEDTAAGLRVWGSHVDLRLLGRVDDGPGRRDGLRPERQGDGQLQGCQGSSEHIVKQHLSDPLGGVVADQVGCWGGLVYGQVAAGLHGLPAWGLAQGEGVKCLVVLGLDRLQRGGGGMQRPLVSVWHASRRVTVVAQACRLAAGHMPSALTVMVR